MIRSPKDFRLAAGNLNRYPKGSADGVIYCRFTHTREGVRKDVRRNTQKTTEREARAVAWTIYQQETGLISEELVPRAKRATAPVGRICDYYLERRAEITKAGEKAANDYVRALARILRIVHPGGSEDAWRDLPCSGLDDTTVHTWRRERYKAVGRNISDERDHDDALNYSLNSELRQARAVFGRSPLLYYRRAGFCLGEGLARFLTVPALRANLKGFTEIPEELDLHMQSVAAAALGRADGDTEGLSAAGAVAYELARMVSCTQTEIVHCRLSWLTPALDRLHIVGSQVDAEGRHKTFKRGTKHRINPVDPERVRSWLRALHGTEEHPGGDAYLIPWSTRLQCARVLCENHVNAWIARHLPDRKKRLHELRKQSGWMALKKTGSIDAAAAWVGDSVVTTAAYYLPKRKDSSALGMTAL